tara:strand:- start:183 stop:539 length:357 start_codon:yes stop_codon:yes gene_type:complete
VIRAVGNKRLSLNDSEYSYYCSLKDKFGESGFVGLFSTDKNGVITSVSPPLDKTVNVGVVYFILNIMMNQRVRLLDEKINKVMKFEEKVAAEYFVDNILERLSILEQRVLGESDVKIT